MPIWLWRLLWPLRSRLSPGTEVGGCFPDFRLRDLEGKTHFLYAAAPGVKTVLWLTNLCGDCRAKIPLLEELARASEGKLRVLAVSILPVDDPLPRKVAPACRFPILLDPEDVVGRRLGQIHPSGVCPLRNVYIVDGRGRILFKHHLSAVDPEVFRRACREPAA